MVVLTRGPLTDHLLQLYVPRPSQAKGSLSACYAYNFRKPLFISYWKTDKGFHHAVETESSKQIPRGQISHSGQQRWRENFISVFFLLATHKVPDSIKKSMISHLSFFKWTGHLALPCKDRIAWGNLNNLRQTINKVGDISEAVILLTMDLPEVLEILGPVVKLMFSTI